MAKGKRVTTATYETRPAEPAAASSWYMEGRVLIPMIAAYRISGRRGDIVRIPSDKYDELIAKKFIAAV